MSFNLIIKQLKEQLKLELPGKNAQLSMSPLERMKGVKLPIDEINAKKSAVLIQIFPKKGIPHFVFIKRTIDNGAHSGQISFPGGKFEKQDKTLCKTATRETNEEIGISENDIEIIGSLTPLFVPVSNFMIYPYVGFLRYEPNFKKNKDEVKKIIEAGIAEISNNKSKKEGIFKSKDILVKAPFYSANGDSIWGATAMILSEFFEIYSRINIHNS
ncbi:MAG: CoA pyrophosphatase [Bacteroidetes bacterium]|nr:CoA pyrophosphatase [Bacteroidota bacterium]MBT6685524.1 CoA pyrophosphatase [Bacteroidota bacterium]MBT7144975.1 CoA pyrophosphatase [Bacteroidota bacterium]MBT7492475.1 CoA pyrophosphatase [Bacteroidota bacterium]